MSARKFCFVFVVKNGYFYSYLKKKKVKEQAVFHLNNKSVSNLLTGLPKGEAGKNVESLPHRQEACQSTVRPLV